MPGAAARPTASSYQPIPLRSMPRSRPRRRADTATTWMGRGSVSASLSPCRARRRMRPVPTVPRPAMPILRGSLMLSRHRRGRLRLRHYVVQGLGALREKLLEVARRLTDAVLVFNQCDADVAFPVLAEAEPRRDGDIRLVDQELGELDRTEIAIGLGDRRPR